MVAHRLSSDRLGALAGVWFVVLGVVVGVLPGKPPASDAPAADVARYFADRHGRIQAGQVVLGLAFLGAVWWFGSVWRLLCRGDNAPPRLAVIATIGLAWTGLINLTSNGLLAGAALRHDELGSSAGVYFSFAGVLASTAALGIAAFLAALAMAGFRAAEVPRWVAVVSAVGVVVAAIASIGSGSDSPIFVDGANIAAFAIFALVVLATSWVLWRDTPSSATVSPSRSPPAS